MIETINYQATSLFSELRVSVTLIINDDWIVKR